MLLLIIAYPILVNGVGTISFTLRQRTMIIKVPSEHRNSVYSLLPTLSLLFQIPLLPVVGSIIEEGGLSSGVILLLVLSIIGSSLLFLYHFFDNKLTQDTKIIQDVQTAGVT